MSTPNWTLGSFPGLTHLDALQRALASGQPFRCDDIQLCPQNHGAVDEAADSLRRAAPSTRFRLHANVRIAGQARHIDASSEGPEADAYFRAIGDLSRRLGATVYTLHAGERLGRPITSLGGRIREIEDLTGLQVGVEGHYPEAGNRWWLSDWEEYAWLLTSGLSYALDLSHLHIVATRSRRKEPGLVRELLSSENCCEVHLSANDGYSDLHCPLELTPDIWWQPLLSSSHPNAVHFYEGNEMRGALATARIEQRIALATRRNTRNPTPTAGEHHA